MNGKTPTRKVGVGATAGAISALIVWGLQQTGLTIPAEIASFFTTAVTGITSYFVKDTEQ